VWVCGYLCGYLCGYQCGYPCGYPCGYLCGYLCGLEASNVFIFVKCCTSHVLVSLCSLTSNKIHLSRICRYMFRFLNHCDEGYSCNGSDVWTDKLAHTFIDIELPYIISSPSCYVLQYRCARDNILRLKILYLCTVNILVAWRVRCLCIPLSLSLTNRRIGLPALAPFRSLWTACNTRCVGTRSTLQLIKL
jgi:hypothetical protein